MTRIADEDIETFARNMNLWGEGLVDSSGGASTAFRAAVAALRRVLGKPDGLAKMSVLLGHPSDAVRLNAATVLLLHGKHSAADVIESIARLEGPVAMSAQLTLDIARSGKLEPFW